MTWQPIETAPTNGTRVLLRVVRPGNVSVEVGFYNDDRHNRRPSPYWQIDRAFFGLRSMRSFVPHHWMPLPDTEVPA